ncbi:hypothetical protein M1L60_24630 [Actinoplanes sp. TRM 88003]|uniref:Uncharacterized protein n=1 Tax=Paractinoplanes aksuensis TaxID=2939490 RepID=A0ABT1DSH4_9ACTN|nr:hypothetical protein [Actinoplanes aksuensis]MCO8273788.1 hypothetical protein [Actinoplanes aksuensis]
MRKGLVITAVIGFVLCGGLGVVVWQLVDLGKEIVASGVTREQFDAQKKGAAEADVRAALPPPLTDINEKDLYRNEPAKYGVPAGASCNYHTIKPIPDAGPELYRFCFVNGALAEKNTVTIPENVER